MKKFAASLGLLFLGVWAITIGLSFPFDGAPAMAGPAVALTCIIGGVGLLCAALAVALGGGE